LRRNERRLRHSGSIVVSRPQDNDLAREYTGAANP
jgi:hypothetical protein